MPPSLPRHNLKPLAKTLSLIYADLHETNKSGKAIIFGRGATIHAATRLEYLTSGQRLWSKSEPSEQDPSWKLQNLQLKYEANLHNYWYGLDGLLFRNTRGKGPSTDRK
jgi:hypothetical protein